MNYCFSPTCDCLMLRIPAVILLLPVAACHASEQASTTDLPSEVVGRWSMEAVYQDGQDVTQEHDPSDDRWLPMPGGL